MCLLLLGGAGCGSIYKDAQKTLPPEPCAQLEIRIAEARIAENTAGQALTRLHEQLDRGLSREVVAPDVDRVETTALELQRRVAAVRDAAVRCPEQSQHEREIERLAGRAKELLEQAQAVRRGPGHTR